MALCAPSGCYYGGLAVGQTRVLWAREPVASVLARAATPSALRDQLTLVAEARKLASGLGLDVGGQYTSYVDWPGDRIVTTIVATRPGEIEAAGFRFPIVGRLPYKGFFAQQDAEREAARLRADGMDVCVVPVSAYSTLGWLDDPVTAPMLRSVRSDAELVELVVHELVHATVYAASAAQFNEGAASFIGEEAALRYAAKQGQETLTHEQARIAEERLISSSILALRQRIEALYEEGHEASERDARRAELEAAARERLAALPLSRFDAQQYAKRVRLGDACLALRGTYAEDIPRHQALLARLGGDLPAYIDRLRQVAEAEDPAEAFFRVDPASPALR